MSPRVIVKAAVGAALVYTLGASAAYVWAQEREMRRRLAQRPDLFLEEVKQ